MRPTILAPEIVDWLHATEPRSPGLHRLDHQPNRAMNLRQTLQELLSASSQCLREKSRCPFPGASIFLANSWRFCCGDQSSIG